MSEEDHDLAVVALVKIANLPSDLIARDIARQVLRKLGVDPDNTRRLSNEQW